MFDSITSKRRGHSTPVSHAGGSEGLLGRFLELVMRRLLLDSSTGGSLTGLAADALLPLILAHPTAYQHLGESSIIAICYGCATTQPDVVLGMRSCPSKVHALKVT